MTGGAREAHRAFGNETDTQTQHTNMRVAAMKAKRIILGSIGSIQRSKWRWPALMTLAILVAALGVSGCQPHH